MRLSPEAVERVLQLWPVARLATLGPEGAPHIVPIVFARLQDRLWSPIDGKPKREAELQRVRNLRRDPRVSLLLDEYSPDWQRLWWLRIDGRARVLRSAEAPLAPVERALRDKYPQYEQTPVFSGEPTLLEIQPERISSWCA